MEKQIYDTLIACGFEFINYPPKLNQTMPIYIKVKHPDFKTIIRVEPTTSLKDIISKILYEMQMLGEEVGEKTGKTELRKQFKNLLDL